MPTGGPVGRPSCHVVGLTDGENPAMAGQGTRGATMRIAITGTHGSGKSTLIEDFLVARPGYAHAQEPYWELAQRGVVFADGPTVADLEEQLAQSAAMIAGAGEPDIIFDRCPLDFIAYLDVLGQADGIEWSPDGALLGRIDRSIAALDLIGFVPLTTPDEIATAIEYPKLRRRVDARLKAIIGNDELGLLADGPPLIELSGPRDRRAATLLAAIAAG